MKSSATALKRKRKTTGRASTPWALVLVALATSCRSAPEETVSEFELHRRAALAAEAQGDWEEAAGLWSELVLAGDPLWRDACIASVAAYRELNDLYNAQGMLELGLRRAPDDVELRELHAEVLLDLGFRRAAEDRLTQLLEAHPERARSLLLLARARFELGHEQRSLEAIERRIALDSACPETWYLRGRCHQNLGQTLKAYEDFRNAFESGDADPGRLLCAASLYTDAGVRGNERARYLSLLWLHRVVEDDPQCCTAFYLLGMIQEEAGSERRAVESYRRAVELDPTSIEYLTALAELSATLGRHADARVMAERALALEDDTSPDRTRRLRRLLDELPVAAAETQDG